MKRLSILALSFIIAGCSLNPTYERPETPVPDHYDSEQAAENTGADLAWEEIIKEPRLKRLIDLALENNRDLQIATERVAEARAMYGIERADILPGIGATAQESAQRMPEDMRMPGASKINRNYTAGFGISSFEIDFWGKKRSLSEAAFERYLATDEARKTAHIELITQVASTYFTLRSAEQQKHVAAKTSHSNQETVNLVQQRFNSGVASAMELNQSKMTLQTAKASLAQADRAASQAKNALEVLIGQPLPTNLPEPIEFGSKVLISQIPAGVSSDLITRRPDIIAAEHELKASNANIGAARAAFFPSISLTAMLGTISPNLSGLFGGGSETWLFNPEINTPIFTGGALKNSLDAAKIRKNIAVSQYEKTIQVAFKEVADALVGEETYKNQLDALREQQKAAYETLDLAQLRYKNGIDSFLQVQSAQIALFGIQQNFLQVGLESLINRLELYKALGGGWNQTTIHSASLNTNNS